MIENFDFVCRLCLFSDSSINTFHRIFGEEDAKESSLAMKINYALEIKVSNDKTFPNIVCNECKLKVETILIFKSWLSNIKQECSKVHFLFDSYNLCGDEVAWNHIVSASESREISEELSLNWLLNLLNSSKEDFDTVSSKPSQKKINCNLKDATETGKHSEKNTFSVIQVQNNLRNLETSDSISSQKTLDQSSCVNETKLSTNIELQKNVPEEKKTQNHRLSDSLTNIIFDGTEILNENGFIDDSDQSSCESIGAVSNELPASNADVPNEKPLECPECTSSFFKRNLLLKHLMSHQGAESKYQCSICNRKCISTNDLNRHLRVHKGLKPYHCHKCDQYFSQKNLLDKHLDWHEGRKRFLCDICGQTLSCQSNLTMHMLQLHSSTKRNSFQCKECNRLFARKHHLENHYAVHKKSRPYQCSTCGVTFKRSCQLKEHEYLHTGEKQYKCTECDKVFAKKRVLNVHKLLHSGMKPHQCMKCKKSFVRRGGLVAHLKNSQHH